VLRNVGLVLADDAREKERAEQARLSRAGSVVSRLSRMASSRSGHGGPARSASLSHTASTRHGGAPLDTESEKAAHFDYVEELLLARGALGASQRSAGGRQARPRPPPAAVLHPQRSFTPGTERIALADEPAPSFEILPAPGADVEATAGAEEAPEVAEAAPAPAISVPPRVRIATGVRPGGHAMRRKDLSVIGETSLGSVGDSESTDLSALASQPSASLSQPSTSQSQPSSLSQPGAPHSLPDSAVFYSPPASTSMASSEDDAGDSPITPTTVGRNNSQQSSSAHSKLADKYGARSTDSAAYVASLQRHDPPTATVPVEMLAVPASPASPRESDKGGLARKLSNAMRRRGSNASRAKSPDAAPRRSSASASHFSFDGMRRTASPAAAEPAATSPGAWTYTSQADEWRRRASMSPTPGAAGAAGSSDALARSTSLGTAAAAGAPSPSPYKSSSASQLAPADGDTSALSLKRSISIGVAGSRFVETFED
jgi:hypothetical protein